MKHYLNVCDVNGAEVEPVDLITFGSPCQDLSVAGKRKGLKHEDNGDDETTRSGLFMEAVRIIKEMRKKDELEQLRSGRTDGVIRPRFAVWENVPGAFSSNNGEDFRTVLEELARVKDTEVSIPRPAAGGGKWKAAGEIIGDGWSIAWRTLDAQYHGVPQRRRRIFLVADFADECAGEILFECEGLPGYSAQSEEKGQGTSTDSSDCIGRTGKTAIGLDCYNQQFTGDVSKAITSAATDADHVPCVAEPIPYTMQIRSGCEGGGNVPLICEPWTYQKVSGPLMANTHPGSYSGQDAFSDMPVTEKKCYTVDDSKMGNTYIWEDQANTLAARDYKGPQAVCYALDRSSFNQGENAKFDFQINDDGTAQTLLARGPGAVCYSDCNKCGQQHVLYQDVIGNLNACDYKRPQNQQVDEKKFIVEKFPCKYIVRRLTPTECARLQGMPDEWCRLSQIEDMSDEDFEFWQQAHKTYSEINGKTYKAKNKQQMIAWYNKLQADASEYKAYGNGMALPCVRVAIHGIAKHGAKTMASLFDGIGGFPLAGVLDGIKPIWTSEIELFPIAVTLERFREYERHGFFTYGHDMTVNDKQPSKEKEIKEMELKINEVQLPAQITFNYEELKAELTERVHIYETMVYTDDQIKAAKDDRANLNKLKKALNDERIRREKEYMVPFNTFKAQITELCGIIDKAAAAVDTQVKTFEDNQKREKQAKIMEIKAKIEEDNASDLQGIVLPFDDKWLNASTSIKSIEEALKGYVTKITTDLATLQNLPEFGFEAVEVYKSTLDINRAIGEAQRMSAIAKAKAEREAEMARRAEEEAARKQAEAEAAAQAKAESDEVPAEEEPAEEKPQPARAWIKFQALMTVDDALALKAFLNSRNIEYKAI